MDSHLSGALARVDGAQGAQSQGAQNLLDGMSDIDLSCIDVVDSFLRGRGNANTERAYRTSLKSFFGEQFNDATVREFLSWPPPKIRMALQIHRNKMLDEKQTEASINRRMAAIRSLLRYAFQLGLSQCDGRNIIDSEKVRPYRDTSGISLEAAKRLLAAPQAQHGDSARAWRDSAMLTLFLLNGLRCNEVRLLDAEDFGLFERRLRILGKGRGTQKESVDLAVEAASAIEMYLRKAGHRDGPLFRNLDHRPDVRGARMTNNGIRDMVKRYGEAAGVAHIAPHKLRHTAISQLLKRNKGNLLMGAEFSRHMDWKTLKKYWDNIQNLQGEATTMLGNLFFDNKPKRGRPKKSD